ncbi:methyl-galactoside transport system ATP-binding protein [Kineothrix alysoides]|uniref:Ribose/galactose/methyl galactoside import ATP-binding protein n=1 Tax=Kineothrix alysoides TaxID=1469948 RepID=A0A4R1R6A0_9FIRM|nr:sugar ABC transporter ATP-binding protein [Kineothrix alysoides]TCL61084.1 methyl-galactoside transport system ATP-binding protein [Kineothrix alysoides]
MSKYMLEMNEIYKSFPGVQALDNVTIKVRPGTVHALMGENGAGKSTLMKCLFGIYKMDAGEIIFQDKPVKIANADDALKKGIAMVHQELQPIPERSIGENIFCGRYPLKSFGPIKVIDHKKMYAQAERLLEEVRMPYNPRKKMGTLSISQMQSVEIAKAVSMEAKVVILDEPTSSLTDNEVEALFTIIEDLKKKGVSIIYISHKMDEILRISDDVSIMRDGQYVGTWEAKDLTMDMIIAKMVGRELTNVYPPKDNVPGEVILELKELTSIRPGSFKNVNLTIRKGEILGIGGLVGAQRTELMEAVFGIRHIQSGDIFYKGQKINIRRPHDAIQNGIGLITEDRRGTGIFGVLSIADNVSIASIDKYLDAGIMVNDKKVEKLVQENVAKLSIKTPSSKTQIKSLSGGNQQKVVISRWLANNPEVLIMDEPTRGIDVGAKYEIYQIMIGLAKQGKAIVMISSEMAELIGVSDRIAVMCNGRVTGELTREEATQERIMQLATHFDQGGNKHE